MLITKRNGIFSYLKAVPAALPDRLGKREFLISLRTRNSSAAFIPVYNADIHNVEIAPAILPKRSNTQESYPP